MTTNEASMVLAILKAAYPSSYNNMTKREANGTVAVWAIQFADIPVDIVLMAVQKMISTSKFPPSISEVKGRIQALHWEAYECITSTGNDLISPEIMGEYKRIYEATRDYRNIQSYEPTLDQMLLESKTLLLGGE